MTPPASDANKDTVVPVHAFGRAGLELSEIPAAMLQVASICALRAPFVCWLLCVEERSDEGLRSFSATLLGRLSVGGLRPVWLCCFCQNHPIK